MTEAELATAVQAARGALQALLTAGEWKTRPTSGSDYPETFEDAAREIAQYDFDERAVPVGAALAIYQAALGALLEHAIQTEIHKRLAGIWCSRRRPALDEACTTYDDVLAEATWAIRRAAARYNPERGSFFSYAYLAVMQALDLWWRRQQVPVEIPEKMARDENKSFGRGPEPDYNPQRASDSVVDAKASEDHMIALLDSTEDINIIAQELGVPVEDLI